MCFDAYTRKPQGEPPNHVFLLLHGYAQTGSLMLRALADQLPAGALVIAPNAPLPIPEWEARFPAPGWRAQRPKLRYAWYHYDSTTNEYMVSVDPALEYLKAGLEAFGCQDLPKTVIGFSQGGYVAPFIAAKLTKVRQVIGISCEFLPDDLPGHLPFRVDAIFGDRDEIADQKAARASHASLVSRGTHGEFHEARDTGHEISPEVQATIRKMLSIY